MVGRLCALLANINRSPQSPALQACDFMPALAAAQRNHEPATPVVVSLDDTDAQSTLVARSALGVDIPPQQPPPAGFFD